MPPKKAGVVFVEERQNQILQMLSKEKKLLVEELCKHFQVSPATIRNDLNELSNRGLLMRTHGGAVSVIKVNYEQNTSEKQLSRKEEKLRIAKAAAALVQDGDTLALDTGSTTGIFAALLTAKNLTIVTNDLPIALSLEAHRDYRLVLLGGVLRNDYHCTLGPSAEEEMRGLHVDKAFLATNSVSAQAGLSTPDLQHAEIKRRMIQAASQKILLATGNKFGRKSFVNFASAAQMDAIITDASAPPEEVAALQAQNINVQIV